MKVASRFKLAIWKVSIALGLSVGALFPCPSRAGELRDLPRFLTNDASCESAENHDPNSPPPPPCTPPDNETRSGGGLNPLSSCSNGNENLRALVPVTNPVLTTSKHPKLLVYVPFGAQETEFGEFSILLWPGEQQRLYKTRFALPDAPGIVSIALPELPEYALEEGQWYRWYFQIYCRDNTDNEPDLTVNGAIQRVELTPERDRQIQAATPEIWYDTLATVGDRLQASPQDTQLQDTWRNLLRTIDAEDLAEETVIHPVILLEE